MRVSTRVVLLLALLASVLSFAKFNHCASTGWQSPDQYVHACYSDIPALYGERELDDDRWSYSSDTNAVEYPVLTGTVMWFFARVIPSGENEMLNYYRVNQIFLAGLFLFIYNKIWITSQNY